jgi:hypothetical protein
VAGLSAAIPASGQEQAPAPSDGKKPSEAKKDEPADKQAPPKKGALLDKNGREYRVCDMCGGNMYLEEKLWSCEQCGFSYEV